MRLYSLKVLCSGIAFFLTVLSYGQNGKTVTGTVTDENGVSMPGVNVLIKGTSTGAQTDFDGKFSLQAQTGDVLVFSFLGMNTVEKEVGLSNEYNIILKEATANLNEVLVVGYGTQTKRSVTGTVASVDYDNFQDRTYSNVSQALAGQLPGVNINQGQGAPGQAPIIRIRGINSITAGTSPLYVVDGIPLENFDLNLINPQDIASVDVLKDASAAAIYGSRGANGVILITTKIGAPGKPQITLTQETGIQQVTREVDVMNAQQFIDYYVDAHNNAWIAEGGNANDPNSARPKQYQIPPDFITNPEMFGKGTDWQDVMFRAAPLTNTQLTVSGGTENTQYLFSGGYLNQKAVLDQNYYNRVTLRTNIRQKVTDKITLGLNLSFAGIYDRTGGTQGKSDVVSLGLQSDPIFPVYNENGNLGFRDPNSEWYRFTQYSDFQQWHPYSLTREIDKQQKTFNTLGNAFIEYEFLDGLTFKSSINANLSNRRYYSFRNEGMKYGYSVYLPAQGDENTSFMLNWLTENTLTYDKTFGDHSLKILAGYTAQKQRDEYNAVTASDYPNDLVPTLNAGVVNSGTSTASEWSLLSYLGRVNYDYKNKYYLTATLRRDGSSRFGQNTKWGYFPSVSGGWLLSDENFLSNTDWVNLLKLRASYGVTGNNQIPNYGSISLLSGSNYVNGTTLLNGLSVSSIANEDLKWEKTNQFNIGLDLDAFKNHLQISFNYYHSTTNDLLLNIPIPDITGFSNQLTNLGKVQNQGVEFNITGRHNIGEIEWKGSFNYGMNRNKVLKLGPDGAPIIYTDYVVQVKTEIGQPISNFYGYKYDGVFNNQSEIDAYPHHPSTTPGDPKIRDVNNDGLINTDDRTTIGNFQPDFTAGFTNTFTYKGVGLSFLLQSSFGGEITNQLTRYMGIWNGGRNAFADVHNYWRSESDPGDGYHFKPTINPKGLQNQFSTYWVEDASYVRLKNINLSYDLPKSLMDRTFLSSARVYLNIENAYLWSKYSNYDPENTTYTSTTYSGTSSTSPDIPSGAFIGVDYGSYPVPRIITVGTKINF